MRRLVVALLAIALLGLAACSSTSNPQTTSTQTAAAPAVGTFTTPTAIKLGTWQPKNDIDPCSLVKAADLTKVFTNVSDVQLMPGYDANDPYGDYAERTCEYAVTIADVYANNPSINGNYQFVVAVTTYGKDGSNDIWTILSQGQLPVTGVGDGAFHVSGQDALVGDSQYGLTAHKGSTIVNIQGYQDPLGYMGNSTVLELMNLALSRAPR